MLHCISSIKIITKHVAIVQRLKLARIVSVILRLIWAVGKTRRGAGTGVGGYWVQPEDWELGDHVNEVCCFDSKGLLKV